MLNSVSGGFVNAWVANKNIGHLVRTFRIRFLEAED